MFTGLVEGLGTVARLEAESAGIKIVIVPPKNMLAGEPGGCQPTRCGDSIAINGCCLTVISIESEFWSFQAGKETLSKTNLGQLVPNDLVNRERSLPANGRLGGHFVQGHVDGVGIVDAIERDNEWVTMGFEVPNSIAQLLVPKGSISVDGVSLTIVNAEKSRFTVALIPHTLSVTTLGHRSVGQTVNIETDILGKYAKQFLSGTLK